jgi:hypothetical protein
MKRARTAGEVWDKLADEAGEDAIERAASVSVGHAERELREAGFDVAAERAKADALMARLETKTAPSEGNEAGWVSVPPAPSRKSASRNLIWLWAAVLAATTAGGVLYALGRRSKPHDVPDETPAPTVVPRPPPSHPPNDDTVAPTREEPGAKPQR